MTSQQRWRRSLSLAVIICIGIIITQDVLFRGPLGWTVGLFGGLLLAGIAIRTNTYLRSRFGISCAVVVVLTSLACIEHPGALAMTLGTVALIGVSISARSVPAHRISIFTARIIEFVLRAWIQAPLDAYKAGQWRRRRGAKPMRGLSRLIGRWFVPIVLSLVFIGLFTLANPIISSWADSIGESFGDLFRNISKHVPASRFVRWVLFGGAAWALLRTKPRYRGMTIAQIEQRVNDASKIFAPPPVQHGSIQPPPLRQPLSLSEALDKLISPELTVRCLVLFNALFAVQTALDVMYLWGGVDLPTGITYAEYAHRGAYPLVATALLAALFVLITFRQGAAPMQLRTARWLVYAWIAQNILLTCNAVWRLSLYVDAYTLTRLRVAAGIWMLLVIFGLFAIIWRIVRDRSNSWLVSVNTASSVFTLVICSFLNIDGFIADTNVRHAREVGGGGQPLDISYLKHLGPEAIPALHWFEANASIDTYVWTAEEAVVYAHKTRKDLMREVRDATGNWRGWTYRRARLLSSEQSVDTPDGG